MSYVNFNDGLWIGFVIGAAVACLLGYLIEGDDDRRMRK